MRIIDRRGALLRLGALAAACCLPARAWAGAPFDIAQLMQALAQVRSGTARFVEKRSVSVLERTLESSGLLSFEAPDTFVRETLKPRQERIAIVGNQLTLSQGQRSRTVPLDSVPEASLLMEAVRGTLTGNLRALERNFSVTASGTMQRWSLDLVPRESRLRELVISVRVVGEQVALREVTLALADGDRSVMTIEPAAAPEPSVAAASAVPRSASAAR
ncbi:MAG: LolA-related protein [Burkholderiaceae bacterium]